MLNIRPLVRRLIALVLVASCTLPAVAQATMVRLNTVLGPVDIELYDTGAPLTVANFLGYVRSGAYANSFIHRSAGGFVIQGGGYNWVDDMTGVRKIPAGPPVVNEFSASRSNLPGTVAMAKLGGDPHSATTEWFVNLANNAGPPASLDTQNGGFTVFGKVTEPGMAVVNAIASLQVVNAGGAFNTLPVLSLPPSGPLLRANLVMVNSVSELPAITSQSDSDRIFNYLEAAYPQFVAPANDASATALGYYYRHYPGTNAYVGTRDGMIHYLVPAISNEIQLLGRVQDWLAVAAAAGY